MIWNFKLKNKFKFTLNLTETKTLAFYNTYLVAFALSLTWPWKAGLIFIENIFREIKSNSLFFENDIQSNYVVTFQILAAQYCAWQPFNGQTFPSLILSLTSFGWKKFGQMQFWQILFLFHKAMPVSFCQQALGWDSFGYGWHISWNQLTGWQVSFYTLSTKYL